MMKTIPLSKVYDLARSMSYEVFEQHLKSYLTEMPYTTEIDCDPVVIDKNEL